MKNKVMTQEDKKLLLKDLSARFPYGVVLDVDTTDWKAPQGHIQVKIEGYGIIFKDMSLIVNGCYYGDNYKPFLRSMSSMTEDEKKEYKKACDLDMEILSNHPMDGTTLFPILYHSQDYLNSIHVDYRGLIERGLALKALDGMYGLKEK